MAALALRRRSSWPRRWEWTASSSRRWLDAERVVVQERRYVRSAEMRYVGQSFEVSVPIATTDPASVATAFHARHRAVYGFADENADTEIVDIRVQLIGAVPSAAPEVVLNTPPRAPTGETRRVWFGNVQHETTIIQRAAVQEAETIHGPAIVEQYDSTLVLPPGWELVADGLGNLIGQRQKNRVVAATVPLPAVTIDDASLASRSGDRRRGG
jgi:N-methylhydantoinase A